MSTKRKYFTLQKKGNIVKLNHSNPKFDSRKIAKHYQCGKTNIQSILKHKDESFSEWEQNANANIKKKNFPAEFSDKNYAVWKWFCTARKANVAVSGPVIQEEARQVVSKLGTESFNGFNGWLQKWKNRLTIPGFRTAVEDGDANPETLKSCAEPNVVKEYELKNIWNADETRLQSSSWKTTFRGHVACWLATCIRKPKVPDSSPAGTYVQRWALCSNRPANI